MGDQKKRKRWRQDVSKSKQGPHPRPFGCGTHVCGSDCCLGLRALGPQQI